MLSRVNNIFDKIDFFFFWISKLSLIAMMILISVDSVGRYLFNEPLPWAYKFTESYLMVVLVFLSLSYVDKLDGHIHVDIFLRKLPGKIKKLINLVSLLLSFLLMTCISYFAFLKTFEAWEKNYVEIGVVEWPVWLTFVWVGIGGCLLSIRILLKIVSTILPSNKDTNKN